MKKITFLVLHLNYGGIEKQVTNLANNLVDRYEVNIISLYNILGHSFYKLSPKVKVKYILPFGPNKDELKVSFKKMKFLSIFKELSKSLKILWYKYFKISKYIKEIDTDILISTRIEFTSKIKRDDILVISQEHSYIDTPNYIKKVKKSFKNTDYIVVMTNKAKEEYEKWFEKVENKPNIVAIPNIIEETNEVSNLKNKQIISIGRLEEVKDFPLLIDTFKIVSERNPEWTLKICGEGSKRKEIEDKIKEHELSKKVFLTGRIDIEKLNKEILKSSIFVLTSKSESFSLVIASAMSFGVPPVSFDIDVGPREIIKDGEDGFLIKSRNPLSMAKKICELIENEPLRKKIGENAHKNIQRLYATNILDKWYKIFEK